SNPRQKLQIPGLSLQKYRSGWLFVEMSMCIDDCCPAGERASCHDRTASPSRQQNRKLQNIGLGRAVTRRGRHTAPRKRRRFPLGVSSETEEIEARRSSMSASPRMRTNGNRLAMSALCQLET